MKVGEKLYCIETGFFSDGCVYALIGKYYEVVDVSYDPLRVVIIDEEDKEHRWTVNTDKFKEHFMKPLIPRKIKKHKL
jgi:hypothetical protein